MVDIIEVECKYCGSLIEMAKAVRLNPETEEYEYACVNCAIRFEKMKLDPDTMEN
jgi:DNA-directed RNA polymerase subunit RPC12/RpoP